MIAVYVLFFVVAGLNWALMRRPRPASGNEKFLVLIPARNEAHNLRELLPQLTPQASVMVFDDESDDGTALMAEELGATVLRPAEPLPKGWTGKNRACHELGLAAASTDADWWLFLDADVRVTADFIDTVRASARSVKPDIGCITAFPTILPGRFPEPMFLGWVGWILLATNPFGLVSRTRPLTGVGHNMFTNGQITVWRPAVWTRLRPNEQLRSAVLEDVKIGRLLNRERVGVEVLNLSRVMSVQMYQTWRQALDGMSKNSYEIMGSLVGSVVFALLLLVVAWGWARLSPWWAGYALLVGSGFFAAATCSRGNVLKSPLSLLVVLMPVLVTLGAFTILRSTVWKLRGMTSWKGRVYP